MNSLMESDANTSPPPEGGLWRELRSELKPERLVPSLMAGSVTSILAVVEAVSYGALIFSGVLAAHVSYGVSVTLTAAAVAGLVTALMGSYKGAVAFPQNQIAPILALVAAGVAAAMPAGASPDQTLLTVMGAIIFTSLVTGVSLGALGVFKLGRLIRFIPYQVIAGFLAGAGWLLMLGAMKTMTGKAVHLHSLPGLFEKAVLLRWLPGLMFALAARGLMRRFKHSLVMPGLLAGAIAIFYAVLFFTHTSVAEAREAGWLIHLSAGKGLWKFMTWQSLTEAQWPVIFSQAGGIATIVFVSAVSVLLIASALELASEQELDLDRELNAAGAANVLSGLAGGMVAFTSLSISSLVLRLGGRSRLVGLMVVAAATVVLFLGADALSYCPEPVIGGLLMFLGLGMVVEWAYDTRRKLPRSAWITVLIILASVGLFGFLQGVLVGVVAAIITFVVRYSTIDVVKHQLSGAQFTSNVDRPLSQQKVLREQGGRIFILKLHGFIFFGTANRLLNEVRARAVDPAQPPLKFMVLDYQEVTGIDASAVVSLIKMHLLARRLGFELVFTHLSDTLRKQMEHGGLTLEGGRNLRSFPNLDYGVENCENELLAAEGVDLGVSRHTLPEYFERIAPGALDFAKFAPYLERREAPAGEMIIKQGNPSEDLYFLESGAVTVLLGLEHGDPVRLRKMGPGTVVGELGMYLALPRTASVITDVPSVLYRLSRESLLAMEAKDPKISSAFHKIMVMLLAQRLISTDQTLKALLD